MKKLLLIVLLFHLFSYAQETIVFDTKDAKIGVPIQGTQVKIEKPVASLPYEKYTLFIESNINYAPIGFKFLVQEDNEIGGYVSIKISEDHFLRNVNKTANISSADKNAIFFDINEFIVCGGPVFSITNNIDFFVGVGVMSGSKFVPYSTYIHSDKTITVEDWKNIPKSIMMPLFSFGIILTKNKFKFSFGSETAFTRDEYFMQSVLNQKSFARLSSLTFGVGYTFGKK